MRAVVIFVLAVIWGSLAAQFLVQLVVSFIIALLSLAGVVFSKVSKIMNMVGALTALFQSIIFGVLFVGGNWLTSGFISYDWDATSIASLLSFLGTIVYIAPQLPGKFLLARMCAWKPYFSEASMAVPRNERVAFARQARSDSPRRG
jgi:hypothetical protein